MIPIRDTIPSKNYPVVNTAIIAANVLIFLIQMTQGDQLNRFIVTYGLVPVRYSAPEAAAYFTTGQQLFSFFSYMFLHGGFWHLLGNMWSLYIFGDNVEDRLGPLRYLTFFICCGLASGATHLFLNWRSPIPTIGASGAIAGVMGAYFVLYPKSRILTLIPIFFIPYFVELSAFFFLGIWFLFQFISAAGSSAEVGGVAWWAHIGGFAFGILFLKIFLFIPETGMSRRIRKQTLQRKTPRLQVIRTGAGASDDPNLYGNLALTPKEAEQGATKLVNIPWGIQKRLFNVSVPAGVRDNTTLRLTGMGRELPEGRRGDLYLKIAIQQKQPE